MKVTGIIAEYNPFHNGHAYQIQEVRRQTASDFIIVVMSGDFVQRGAPAMVDKYTRANMALSSGADLVLELPTLWSTSSAEFFASAGVALLDQLGVVDTISFGCETSDCELSDHAASNIEAFETVASLLVTESCSYQTLLKEQLKSGISYPSARLNALVKSAPTALHEDIRSLLSSPNNLLGIEYEKALLKRGSSIRPLPIKRVGNGYHEESLGVLSSATGIRKALRGTLSTSSGAPQTLASSIPAPAFEILSTYLTDIPALFEDDFSSILYYRLLQASMEGNLTSYADCSQNFANKIQRNLDSFLSYSDFCQTLKSKDLTYTRISRNLLHILLNLREEDYHNAQAMDYTPYARVLGFCKSAAPLFSQLKANSSLPLVTSLSDARKTLAPESHSFLERELYASRIYRGVASIKGQTAIPDECSRKMLVR